MKILYFYLYIGLSEFCQGLYEIINVQVLKLNTSRSVPHLHVNKLSRWTTTYLYVKAKNKGCRDCKSLALGRQYALFANKLARPADRSSSPLDRQKTVTVAL